VLDEAQRIRDWATKSALTVKQLDPPYPLVVTGTPMDGPPLKSQAWLLTSEPGRTRPAAGHRWTHIVTTCRIEAVKEIPAARFKAQCLALIDRLGPEGIVITKRGKPVAKLIPFGSDSGDLIGRLRGKLRIRGDILSTGLRWDAESRHARPASRARR
jgi:antitoxin (DNA-binding transcriptional repressor) of toxin-antitoxin stability system